MTLKTAASHQSAFGGDGEVAVGTVAAAIDGVAVKTLRNGEQPFFVEIERPQVIFKIECGATVFVTLIALPAIVKQFAVSFRLDVPTFVRRSLVFTCRAITSESENVDLALHHQVDNVGNFVYIGARHGAHHSTMESGFADGVDGFECAVK